MLQWKQLIENDKKCRPSTIPENQRGVGKNIKIFNRV
jgi:hypothetical protein